ncbi:MAG: class I SAM-dependent methyltransferase [Patescibacteria group bacterium]|nr:class I SAM-dependent methyltransferase [Patescibacteria group bacterium]
MNNQKKYWEEKIIKWEKNVYQGKNYSRQPIFEKIATPFRRILKTRLNTAEKLVSKHIKNKIVADLGCGSGIFIMNLLKYNPKKLVGVDIAPSAVKFANGNVKKERLGKKIKFVCEDVRKNTRVLKNVDVVTGIGFIDYFNREELQNLLNSLKGKIFMFSFPQKIITPREILHRVYLLMASCPGSYKYTKSEMDEMIKKAGFKNWWYYDKESIRFVTNLPKR